MNRFRSLTLFLLLVVAVTVTACGDDDDETEGGSGSASATAEVDTVERGVLTVCSDIPYAPFEYEDESGEVIGVDIDLMRAIGEQLGLELEVKDTDFDGIFAALAADQCDVIASSVSITDERKENNEFTQGYFEIQQSVLVRKDEVATYKALEDLAGKTIAVQSETTGEAYAQENKPDGAEITSFTGADEMFTALKAGQVDAVLQDFPINAYHAETSGETEVAFTLDSDPEEYGFVIKKGNTALRDAINDALTALRDDGTYDEVLEKHLGEVASAG